MFPVSLPECLYLGLAFFLFFPTSLTADTCVLSLFLPVPEEASQLQCMLRLKMKMPLVNREMCICRQWHLCVSEILFCINFDIPLFLSFVNMYLLLLVQMMCCLSHFVCLSLSLVLFGQRWGWITSSLKFRENNNLILNSDRDQKKNCREMFHKAAVKTAVPRTKMKYIHTGWVKN